MAFRSNPHLVAHRLAAIGLLLTACYNAPSGGDGTTGTDGSTGPGTQSAPTVGDPSDASTPDGGPDATESADASADSTATDDGIDETDAGDTTATDGDTGTTTGEPEVCPGPFAFTWQAAETIQFPGNLQGLDGADIDGDGDYDLVAADYGNQAVHVYLGNGDGTFTLGTQVNSSGNPNGVRLAAISDDTIDLFINYYNSANFTYQLVRWRGNGAGGFQFGSQPMSPVNIFDLGYVNGDNYLDIVSSANDPVGISLRTADVAEAYGAATQIAAVSGRVFVRDLDGDNDGDVVVVGPPNARTLINNNGVFNETPSFAVHFATQAVDVGDTNDDGNPDLVTGTAGGGLTFLEVFPGDGNGGFGAPTQHSISNYTTYVRVRDVDADGIGDLVPFFGDTLTFMHSNGDLTFDNEVITNVAMCQNARDMVLTDINGDCVLDAIVGCSANNDSIRVFLSSL